MIPRTLIATAALALCATVAGATDLLQVWQAARQHDPQGAVSEAAERLGPRATRKPTRCGGLLWG
jgi:outer membrane protein